MWRHCEKFGKATCRNPRISSCSGGKRPPNWYATAKPSNSASSPPTPFPALEEGELKHRIRDLGERLDAHRKRQQDLHPDLVLTGICNVLAKLRTGEALTAKDKAIHDQGLVSVLRQIHDDLDAAMLESYGWGDMLAGGPPCSGAL